MGKPIPTRRTKDVPRTAQNFRFFADHARLATGEVLPMDTRHHAYSRFEPAGVVAAIAPWNFPLMLSPGRSRRRWPAATPSCSSPPRTPRVGDACWRAGARGRAAARRAQRRSRLRPGFGGRGADRRTAASTGSPSPASPRRAGRSPGGRGQPGAGQPRTRRQGRQPGLRRRRPGRRGRRGRSRRSSPTPARCAWPARGSSSSAAFYEEFVERFVAAAEAMTIGDPKDPRPRSGRSPRRSTEEGARLPRRLAAGRRRMLTGGPARRLVRRPTVVVDAPRDARLAARRSSGRS